MHTKGWDAALPGTHHTGQASVLGVCVCTIEHPGTTGCLTAHTCWLSWGVLGGLRCRHSWQKVKCGQGVAASLIHTNTLTLPLLSSLILVCVWGGGGQVERWHLLHLTDVVVGGDGGGSDSGQSSLCTNTPSYVPSVDLQLMFSFFLIFYLLRQNPSIVLFL